MILVSYKHINTVTVEVLTIAYTTYIIADEIHLAAMLWYNQPCYDAISHVVMQSATGCNTRWLLFQVNCINIMADGITTTETNIKSMLMRAKELSPAVLLLKNIDLLTREDVLKGHCKCRCCR